MKKIKFRTEFSNDFGKFITKSGNGKAVPQFELNENKEVVPVIDKETGEQVVHNLYVDIQKNKHANDYKHLLESGVDPIMFASKSDVVVDTTKMGSGVDLLKAEQVAKAKGYNSFEDILAKFKQFMEKEKNEKVSVHSSANTINSTVSGESGAVSPDKKVDIGGKK